MYLGKSDMPPPRTHTDTLEDLLFNFSQDNYNKKIAPFSFDKVKNVNIPVNINVSMSVIDIIKIEEVDHVYILKFRLVLEWYAQFYSYP